MYDASGKESERMIKLQCGILLILEGMIIIGPV